MTTTRDFLLRYGVRPDNRDDNVILWHEQLGGAPTTWRSHQLGCVLWGPRPAEIRLSANTKAACLIVGAPIGFGTLDPVVIQSRMLEAYLHEGIGALARVDGSFCGALIDEAASAVYVFTDRFGFRKAFLARRNTTTYASSRAVVLGKGLDLPVDEAGVVSVVMVGHTLARRTLFRDCLALMPATAHDIVRDREHVYWQIARFLAERPRDAAATRELRQRFNTACLEIMAAQRVPVTNLTGGFDTRAMLSAALSARVPVAAITAGHSEAAAVDRIVARTGIRHQYFDERDTSNAGAAAFALLTDGEWDASDGGSFVRHWQKAGDIAPSGCLHGGLGEVWRSYHYKFLWPPTATVRRNPVQYLTDRLMQPRRHLLGVLAPSLARLAREIVAQEVASTWAAVSEAQDTLAAVDGFYLIERQRGLSRIASAADLWYPAYAPFGHSTFVEAALPYLGVQNRGETLHRAIIDANSRLLASLPLAGGGTCRPLSPPARWALMASSTGRHLVGRMIGASMRRWLRSGSPSVPYRYGLELDLLEGTGFFDGGGIRAVTQNPGGAEGTGSIGAVAFVLAAQAAKPDVQRTATHGRSS